MDSLTDTSLFTIISRHLMDAAEHDLDAKLYKASSVLLQEIQHKLPLLLFKPDGNRATRRLYVLDQKCEELSLLVRHYPGQHHCWHI